MRDPERQTVHDLLLIALVLVIIVIAMSRSRGGRSAEIHCTGGHVPIVVGGRTAGCRPGKALAVTTPGML
jgi:hypothetical protein